MKNYFKNYCLLNLGTAVIAWMTFLYSYAFLWVQTPYVEFKAAGASIASIFVLYLVSFLVTKKDNAWIINIQVALGQIGVIILLLASITRGHGVLSLLGYLTYIGIFALMLRLVIKFQKFQYFVRTESLRALVVTVIFEAFSFGVLKVLLKLL